MQAPRGTRDFGPAEMAQRRDLERRLRDVFSTYNYREVQTPTFEEIELFLAKSGPGIRDEIYNFKDKSDRELALRPELTAPVMRFYFGALKMEPKPLRLFYFGPCYRYDRPQAGRYREFWQMGCELIGDDSPEGHAELLHLAITLFEKAGLKNYQLRVGHLGILRNWLERLGYPLDKQSPLMRLIDKKDMTGLEKALENARTNKHADYERFLKLFDAKTIDDVARVIGDVTGNPALAHLERLFWGLERFGADMTKIRVDATIARGLEYYTGLVFELDAPELGAEKQLLGGGAYDLSGVFDQPSVHCVGFALGFDRTLVALERTASPLATIDRVHAYVAALHNDGLQGAVQAARILRGAGHRVELESLPISIKRLLARASQIKARHAVFIGQNEAKTGVAAVKDLDAGTQTEVAIADLADRLA